MSLHRKTHKTSKGVILFTILIIVCSNGVFSQNINLSNGIGKVNSKYTYGKLKCAVGTVDSTYSFDPKNLNPMPKSLAYNELFYDNNLFIVRFSYFMLDTLTNKSSKPYFTIYNGSTITLNGDLISNLDSTKVVTKYGKPDSILKSNNGFTISYEFREKKHFSSLTFYFNSNGSINKAGISLGKY